MHGINIAHRKRVRGKGAFSLINNWLLRLHRKN